MIDLFQSLAEAIAPAPAARPSSPPAISRPADPPSAPPPIKAAPPAPTKHRLSDCTGQAFEHEDPEYLRGWIAQRNRALQAQRSPAPQPRVLYFQAVAPRVCGPGGCR